MLDIDHFKMFNDTHGHEAGDVALQELGALLHNNIRGGDIACRYGGEEFLLVLPETSFKNASRLAERLRKQISKKVFKWEGEKISITASFGVTGFDKIGPSENFSLDDLIEMADQYLYQAKNKGRNKVVSGPFLNRN